MPSLLPTHRIACFICLFKYSKCICQAKVLCACVRCTTMRSTVIPPSGSQETQKARLSHEANAKPAWQLNDDAADPESLL